jgi:aminopeptidase N
MMRHRLTRKLLGATVWWLSLVSTGVADTYPRQPDIDAVHYVFRLELGDTSTEISANATVEIRFVKSGVSAFELDLASAASGKGMTVTNVTSPSGLITFTHQNNRLRIALAAPPGAEEHRFFTIAYHGAPANGLRLIPNKYNEWSAFSENWPNRAREWLPMIDHPYDKATSEFIVTAPARYQVVANGLLQEEIDLGDGRRVTHWKQGVPIASWLNAIGVAQFYVHHAGPVKGVPLQTWVAHQDKEVGPLYFEAPARQALEFYSEHVGPYSYEKLANVAAAGISGGTEHASAIFYGERGLRPAPAFGLVAHEIAHQWFGNAITERDWDDVWLSEGFATYFTHLCEEHYLGREVMVAGLKRDVATILNAQKTVPNTAVIHRNLSDMSKVLNRFVYQKGGWVLHMLRARIGTDAFWSGIREYYRRYQNSSASTDDFRRVMEQAGATDLNGFFSQWLTRNEIPKLGGSWAYDAAAKQIRVTLTQESPGDPYRLPVDIGVVSAAGALPRIEKVELAGKSGTFTLAADSAPTSVVLDPNTNLLFEAAAFGQASTAGR